jgi:hypothetical protein
LLCFVLKFIDNYQVFFFAVYIISFFSYLKIL